MHRLALGCNYGLQFIEIHDLHQNSGTWNQIAPYAPQAGRTLVTAHGTWKWSPVTKVYQSGRSRATVNFFEFILEEAGNPVSLGLFAKMSLPTGDGWRYAHQGALGTKHIHGAQFISPTSSRYWLLRHQGKFHPAWFGVFFKVGGHLAAGGKESATGVIANTENFKDKWAIAIETSRVGPGLGGAAGLAVGILTGFPNAPAMLNARDSSWDFGIALAEKWSSYLNLFNDGGKYADLAHLLHRLGKPVDMTDYAKHVSRQIEQLGGLGDIYKVFQAGSSAVNGAGETAYQSNAQTINLFDIPGSGKGIELSVYRSWTEVTQVARI